MTGEPPDDPGRIDGDRPSGEGEQRLLSILGWGTLAVVLVATLTWWFTSPADPAEQTERPGFFGRTSLHTGALGTRALYLLYQQLGIPVARRTDPLELFTPPGNPLIVLAAPSQELTSSELRWLFLYVARGGVVLFVPYAVREGDLQPPPVGLEILEALDLELVRPPAALRQAAAKMIEDEVPVLEMLPARANTPTLTMRGGVRLLWTGIPAEGSRPLAEDDNGMAAAAVRWGDGTFLVVADLSPFTNRALREADNAPFAAALANQYAGSAGILFDEYHHGVTGRTSIFRLLSGTALGWLLLQLAILVLLWLYAGAIRFGVPLPVESGRRRSGLEQVEALANLLERTQARSLSARVLWARFSSRARRSLGLTPAAGEEADRELARTVAALLGEDPELTYRLALEARRHPLTAAELVRLDRHLHVLWRRIDHVARTGRPVGAHPLR